MPPILRRTIWLPVLVLVLAALSLRGAYAIHAQDVPTADDFAGQYENRVFPQMAAATDCASRGAAAQVARLWEQQAQIALGADDQTLAMQYATVNDFWTQTLVVCYNEAFDKCVTNFDPTQATAMVGYLRQLLLAGTAAGPPPVDPAAIGKCLTFELDFDSTITETEPTIVPGFQIMVHVQAKVPVLVDQDTNTGEGSGPIDYAGFTATDILNGFQAVQTAGTQPSMFQVHGLELTLDPALVATTPITRAVIDLGSPQDMTSFYMSGAWVPLESSIARLGFGALHASEGSPGAGYTIQNWTYVGGAVFAKKTYASSVPYAQGIYTLTESTTLELHHTPHR